MADQNIPPPPPGFVLEGADAAPPPPPGFQLQAPTPDDAVVVAAMQHQASLPPAQREAAYAALPQSMRDAIGARIRADAQAAGSPQAQAAHFQQLQDQNVADMGTAGRLWAGIGEGADRFWQGIKENAIDRPLDLVAGGNRVASDEANLAEQRRLSQPLNDTTAGKIGNVIGNIAESAPLMLIPGLGEVGVGARLGAAALTGAGYGYLQPSASGGEELGNIAAGALTGPALAGAAKVGQLAYRGVRSLIDPFIDPAKVAAQRLGKTLARDNVSSATLRAGVQDVPNVEPTLAGVVPTSKRAVQLERSLRNNPETGPEFAARDMQNDRARVAALQQHTQPPIAPDAAGTPENMGSRLVFDPQTGQSSWQTMDALDAARAQRAADFSQFADNNLNPTTARQRFRAAFDHLMNHKPGRISSTDRENLETAKKVLHMGATGRLGPEQTIDILNSTPLQGSNATKYINHATDILNDRMIDPTQTLAHLDQLASSGNPIVRAAASEAKSIIAKKAAQDSGDAGMVHAASLDDVRQNLGNIIRAHANGDRVGEKQAATILSPVKDTIVSTIDKKIPGFRNAVAQYAKASGPINTAEAVRSFLDPTKIPSLATDTPKVSAAQVKAFLSKKRPYPISPDVTNDAAAVQQSIQRAADAQANVGASGSQTAANWASRIGRAALHAPAYAAGAFLGHLAMPMGGYEAGLMAAAGADALHQVGERRVVNELGKLALNPRDAADAIDAYMARQDALRDFNRRLLPTGVQLPGSLPFGPAAIHGGPAARINLLGYLSGIAPDVLNRGPSTPPVAAASGAP